MTLRYRIEEEETSDGGALESDERQRVGAIGKASEALEYIERARGHLYSFHQLMGRGDIEFGAACDLLDAAGLADDAARLRQEIVGRNALDGRWSFQIVDEFDDLYYTPARDEVRRLEEQHLNGRRHAYEANLKEQRRTHGHPAHTSRPGRSENDETS
jgi:hypothetical protein